MILEISVFAILLGLTSSAPLVTQYSLFPPQDIVLDSSYHQPAPRIVPGLAAQRPLPHPAVVKNANWEAMFPPELLNNQYKNPQIAAALAKESWFGRKEFPVYHREAEKIPREHIYDLIARIRSV